MINTIVVRSAIISHLFEHLRAHYDIEPEIESASGTPMRESEIEGLLAFRSDPKLEALRNALVRLDNGSFGMCLRCKRPINSSLLEDDLTMRLCSSCEHELATHVSQIPAPTDEANTEC